MVYILFGKDSFSLHEEFEKIKSSLGSGEMLSTNTSTLDGQHLSLPDLMANCGTMPFLTEKRLVIVEGLLDRFEPPKGKSATGGVPVAQPKGTKTWQPFAEYMPDVPPTTVLVMIDGDITLKNPLLKAVGGSATVRKFVPLQDIELRNWIKSRVKLADATIAEPAAGLLADIVGGDLWVLANEIEKLNLYVGKRTIQETDVRLLVSYAREANIFAMVDAIIRRNSSAALKLLHQLIEDGEATPYLLHMVTRQFRHLLQVKAIAAHRPSGQYTWREFDFPNDGAFWKVSQQAKSYSLQRLESIYHRLLESDISIKTGRSDGEIALDLLLIELCRMVEARV